MTAITFRKWSANLVREGASRVLQYPDRGPRCLAFAIVLLLALPLVFFLVSALANAGSIMQSSARFVLPYALRDTSLMSAGVAFLSVVFGVGLASLVTYIDFACVRILRLVSILPLAFPTYLIAYILVDIERPSGAIARSSLVPWLWDSIAYILPDMRSMTGAILTFSLVLFPYVYLGARIAFVAQGGALIETARSLGRTPFEIYRLIVLPLAVPAIASGTLLVIMETLNDIGASEYLGVRTLAFTIYTTWLNRGDFSAAIQLSLLLIFFVFSMAYSLQVLSKRFLQLQIKKNAFAIIPIRAPRIVSPVLLIFGALPVVFGFVLPMLYLVDQAILTSVQNLNGYELLDAIYDSVRLALLASLCVVVISVIMIYPHRLNPDRWTTIQMRAASYGYAVPGVILGLAILLPMGAFDNLIDAGLRNVFGTGSGLLITGSVIILIFAYLVRFISVGIGLVNSGYDKISRHLDLAARTLGRSRLMSFLLVPTRINLSAIAAAFLLVFVDVVKELPLTLILRPLGINTLATRIYENASIGQFEYASAKALILLLISTIVVLFVTGRQVKIDQSTAL